LFEVPPPHHTPRNSQFRTTASGTPKTAVTISFCRSPRVSFHCTAVLLLFNWNLSNIKHKNSSYLMLVESEVTASYT